MPYTAGLPAPDVYKRQGVVFLDVLNNAERISDHCSNVAARLIGMDAGEDYDSCLLYTSRCV